MQLGVPVEGTWQYWGDQDWFKVDVVEGEQYVFNLQTDGDGWGGFNYRRRHNGPPPPSSGLTIFDQDGNKLAGGWSGTPANLKLELKATYSGTVYAVVDAAETRTTYTLVASTAAADPQPARAIAIGELATGSVQGDFVRLRFSPEIGKVYLLNAALGYGDFRIV